MLSQSLAPVLNHLWQSTVFAVAIGVLVLSLRKVQARVRYVLWLTASTKFLVPFALFMALGSRIHWPSARTVVRASWSAAVTQASRTFSEPVTFVSTSVEVSHTESYWIVALLAIWAVGFVVVTALWFMRWRRIRAMVRAARPLAITLPIRVLSSASLLEPSVFGIFKPVLLLPEGIETHLSAGQLKAIYAHELCHVYRRDNLAAALHMLVEALFWFHPLVWWLETRLIEERERACDEAVLQAGNHPQAYAESILEVCKLCLASPLACTSGVSGADLTKRIETIMNHGIGWRLNTPRRLLLATAGGLAVVVPVAIGLLNPAHAQDQPRDSFEVASIKPSGPARESIYIKYPHGGLVAKGVPLDVLVKESFPGILHDFQIAGAPKWFYSAKYDIEAKTERDSNGKDVGGDRRPIAAWARTQRRIQALLEDRFALKVHHERKELPVYALVVGKNGSKFQESKKSDGYWNSNSGYLVAHGMSIAQFADGILAHEVGRTVLNRTELNGVYDLTLRWVPERQSKNPLADDENDMRVSVADSGPSIYNALKDQLGLKLVPAKGPVDILVIDHIEKPSPN